MPLRCWYVLRNDTLFYELCDELGLYVVDEANIESHGMDFNWDKTLGNKDTRSWSRSLGGCVGDGVAARRYMGVSEFRGP